MKPTKKADRRLVAQFTTLSLLILLPITMIAINGATAVHAILAPPTHGINRAQQDAVGDLNGNGELQGTPLMPKRFGIYDPSGTFDDHRSLGLRHVYVSWVDFDPASLIDQLSQLQRRGLDLLITVEPWPLESAEAPLLVGVSRGDYDGVIERLADVFSALQGPIHVSWGHEMDQDLADRYPWSAADPEQYINAYRYFVDEIRRRTRTEIRWVWAGVMKSESLRFWPGDQYVDFIGMPIYSFPAWERKAYGYIRSFATTFEEKSRIVMGLGKPLMITEMGVSGSDDFSQYWLHQAFLVFDDYPDLATVVFFYSVDSEGVWGEDVPTPDWRVHKDVIISLVDWKVGAGLDDSHESGSEQSSEESSDVLP
jgi:beta-mannanase